MIKFAFFFVLILSSLKMFSCPEKASPHIFISGCEIDLDNNGESDLALVVESSDGCKLIVLMQVNGMYKLFVLFNKCENMNLTCNYGYDLKETTAGKLEGKEYKTNGTFLILSQPESSRVAFFWNENKFKEVWIAD